MIASQTLVNKIKQFEGLRLKSYKCPSGVWTIGYGHTKGVRSNRTISMAMANEYLAMDIEEVEEQLKRCNLPKLSIRRWDAIVDFTFNLGIANFRSSTLYRKIVADQDDKTIPNEFRRWVYSNKKVLAGLVKRREWEAQRWG